MSTKDANATQFRSIPVCAWLKPTLYRSGGDLTFAVSFNFFLHISLWTIRWSSSHGKKAI